MTKILAIKLFSAVTLLAGLGTTGAALSGGFSKALKVSPMTLKMTKTNSGTESTVSRVGVSSVTFIGSGTKPEENKAATSLNEIKTLTGETTPKTTVMECKYSQELEYFASYGKLLNNQPLKLQCKGWGSAAASSTESVEKSSKNEGTSSSNNS